MSKTLPVNWRQETGVQLFVAIIEKILWRINLHERVRFDVTIYITTKFDLESFQITCAYRMELSAVGKMARKNKYAFPYLLLIN